MPPVYLQRQRSNAYCHGSGSSRRSHFRTDRAHLVSTSRRGQSRSDPPWLLVPSVLGLLSVRRTLLYTIYKRRICFRDVGRGTQYLASKNEPSCIQGAVEWV